MNPVQEQGWLGVNMRLAPHLLPPGYASFARNLRFTTGQPETRGGAQFPAWANKTGATGTQPWGEVHGVGGFSDPTTRRVYQVVAADGKIYRCQANNWPVEMSLPAGETITGEVTFTQAAGRLICHRGFDTAPLWCENIKLGWTAIPDPDTSAGVQRFPNVERSLYFQGRMWAWSDEDTLVYSDFNDPTATQPVTQEFYINPGSRSRGVALAKLGNSSLVLLKDHEIHVLYNAYGDLSAAYADTITLEFGCVAAETVVDVGNELWFLSNDGIRALVELQSDSTTGTRSIVRFKTARNEQGQEFPVEISDPIRPLIDRMVSTALSRVSAVYANRMAYFAVPLDRSDVLGEELLANAPNGSNLAIESGELYQYVRGSELGLKVGLVTYTESQTFTASAAIAQPQGIFPDRASGSLRRIYPDTNTAVLVYDFQTSAWAGYYEYSELGFTRLFTLLVRGVNQVFGIEVHGYVAQLDTAAYADQRAVVGALLTFSADPEENQTLQINGGTTVTTTISDINDATHWGIATGTTIDPHIALSNLFVDYLLEGGYYSGSHSAWTAADIWPQSTLSTELVPRVNGFIAWSTTGILPTITHTVTGLDVEYLTERPIETELITRAYTDGELQNGAKVRVDVQTWAANTKVEFLTERVGEEFEVTTYTPDRTAWIYPANRAAYELDNSNDDGMDAGREDYSIQFGPATTTELNLSDGLRLDLHQQRRLVQSVTDPVNWVAGRIRVSNTAGRCRIVRAGLAANAAGEREGAT